MRGGGLVPQLISINLRKDQYLELEKLGIGAFFPLDHFMTEEEFFSVCESLCLPSGEVFAIPVVLDVDEATATLAQEKKIIDLIYMGETVGRIEPEGAFQCNKKEIAKLVFGVSDLEHPGVKRFYEMGDWFIGGKTTLIKRVPTNLDPYELTPEETRSAFKKLGWKTIVGFQTRNVPHRAHEYLQRVALENMDGLFIQPLVGQKKVGDYTPEAILKGYEVLIKDFYPKNSALLGVLSTAMRYAGPREAIFHAIIRRNYGCTHFIVGRDHAGVGDYYEKYEAHDLLRTVESRLGIKIMYLHGPYFCNICDGVVTEHTCQHAETNPNQITEISGTIIRKILSGGRAPDERYFRREILAALSGHELFIEN